MKLETAARPKYQMQGLRAFAAIISDSPLESCPMEPVTNVTRQLMLKTRLLIWTRSGHV